MEYLFDLNISPYKETDSHLFQQRQTALCEAVANLDELEKIVITMSYGLDGHERKSIKEIAESLNKEADDIMRIHTSALRDLRGKIIN